MSVADVVIGSRGSALALVQAELVRGALEGVGQASRIHIMETEGDRRAPDTAWGEGAFVAAIERALLAGSIDIAVHSAKDVPTDERPSLCIAAYLPRADPRDALVVRVGAGTRRLADLPPGTRVGTDSPRRTGFLLARRPDLDVHPLHGNVDTRLRRLDDGQTDALVLACAGLDRLGLGDRIAERLEPDIVPPAPGQGAIAIQVRADDPRMLAVLAAIDHPATRLAVEAERAFLAATGGGCRAPIGALARIAGAEIDLFGGSTNPDGTATAFARRRGPVGSGADLARDLAAALAPRRRRGPPDSGRRHRVLVTRAADQTDELVSALRFAGLDPIVVPTIAIETDPPRSELDAAAGRLHTYTWVVITSANGARAILTAATRILTELGAPSWAAIGPATRDVLEHEGIEVAFQPSPASAAAMAAGLPVRASERVLVLRGDLANGELAVALRARGAEVDDVIAYRTREAPAESLDALRRALSDGAVAGVVFTSGSTVRGLVALGRSGALDVSSLPCVCIGPATAAEAQAAGFRVLAVSPRPDSAGLAATTAQALELQLQEMS